MKRISFNEILAHAVRHPSVPIAVVGDPGTGKTAIAEEFAKRHNIPLVKLVVSTMDETDVSGIVVRNGNTADIIPPKWGKFLCENRGILLLDEFNTGRREVTDAMLTLIQSRHLPNGDKLHEGTVIIALMNDSDQCDNYELSPAMVNRFGWFTHNGLSIREFYEFVNGRLGEHSEKESTKYELYEDWFNRFQKEPESHPLKIALQQAISQGLTIEHGQAYTEKRTVTSTRSLMNLLYWSESVEDFQSSARMFLGPKGAEVIASLDAEAIKNKANAIFNNGRKSKASSKKEADALSQASSVLAQIAKATGQRVQ